MKIYKRTWYKAIAVMYYIGSGLFLVGWAVNNDWFSVFMYFAFASIALIFDTQYSKELIKAVKRGDKL